MKFYSFAQFVILFFTAKELFGQQGNWDTYLADYDGHPGSTLLDMSLIKSAPIKNLPFVVITGVTFKNCITDGFPTDSEFRNLYRISDSVESLIQKLVYNKMVGTFTSECQRLDYYYVSDTVSLRNKLNNLYQRFFSNYKSYVNIKSDKAWDAYLNFLYPNEETLESMINSKVVLKLKDAGDNLTAPRKVEHWLYFRTSNDRDKFIVYAKGINFQIETEEMLLGKHQFPYELKISRVDKVDLETINSLTEELRKHAKTCNGVYDQWESPVVK